MKLKIEIKLDNAAFEAPGDTSARWRDGGEVARILYRLAGNMRDRTIEPGDHETLMDLNWNRVGEARVTR